MKRLFKRAAAMLLALMMLLQLSETGLVAVAEALNPAEQIELTVPERFQDGNNWFFIAAPDYGIGEKSTDKLYIPIQRVGDLDAEAEITLKVVDLSARHDVNYAVELYKDKTQPEIFYDDIAVIDIALNADGQEEFEPYTSEEEFAEIVHEVGGAEILDSEGNVVGSVTATPLDENGNPIAEEKEIVAEVVTDAAEEAAAPEATEEAVTEEAAEAIEEAAEVEEAAEAEETAETAENAEAVEPAEADGETSAE